ncbi:hypothetical protein HPB48_022983 [Haemaphysalis longicornis]|uniref:DUF4371 domain-containing protein n=1 Tax=Haemaphysalis longicornis TaxID=44386 RepID=A0A9J6FYB1_HAELO|nr:hypothetical protein HPB48_022983 [Haemaphysalis longicornis]
MPRSDCTEFGVTICHRRGYRHFFLLRPSVRAKTLKPAKVLVQDKKSLLTQETKDWCQSHIWKLRSMRLYRLYRQAQHAHLGHRSSGLERRLRGKRRKHQSATSNASRLWRYSSEGPPGGLPSNASYLSPAVQNQIIEISGEVIKERLVAKVNASGCFAVLADETTDIAGIEQLTVCARYLNKDTDNIEEVFLGFVPIQDQSGRALADTIIKFLIDLGINMQHLRGQGYDGASSMAGRNQWCASRRSRKISDRIVHLLRQPLP